MVMAHGLNSTAMKRGPTSVQKAHKAASAMVAAAAAGGAKTGIGSRRIFPPHFKLQVLDSYRSDADCKGNQRATARKYNIHRRQIQKWLQAEANLRSSVHGGAHPANNNNNNSAYASNNNNCGVAPRKAAAATSPVPTTTAVACHHSHPRRSELLVALEPHRQRDDDNGSGTATQRAWNVQHPPLQVVQRGRLSPVLSPTTTMGAAAAAATPLDCSVHTRCPSAPAADIVSPRPAAIAASPSETERPRVPSPAASSSLVASASPALMMMPMDLSVRRPSGASSAPVHYAPPTTARYVRRSRSRSPLMTAPPTTHHVAWRRPEEDVKVEVKVEAADDDDIDVDVDVDDEEAIWDLSVHAKMAPPAPTKPLFKPYLLDEKPSTVASVTCNNNNNCTTLPNNNYAFGHSPPPPGAAAFAYDAYTPKPSPTYYAYQHMFDGADFGYVHDESGVLQPATYLRPIPLTHLQHPHHQHQQQRHSYSLDFKLRAIDSYYLDADCKGNQRAVASKHNIHRRQVQKWLKQEDELRERSEKQTHAIVT